MSAAVDMLAGLVSLPRPAAMPRIEGAARAALFAVPFDGVAARWNGTRPTVPVLVFASTGCPDCADGSRSVVWRNGRGECTECLAVVSKCSHGSPVTERHPCLLVEAVSSW